jgi:Popeye protein conserved region
MEWQSLTAMGWQGWAANLCYLLLALSYAVSNMWWLRSLAIAALAIETAYFFFGADRPLWVWIGWNVVFIGTNAIQLWLLLRERLRVRFDEQERLLHRDLFSELSPMDFKRLLKAGEWHDVGEGTVLAQENRPLADVSVLIAGAAKVEVGGKLVALLQPGALIGEMSFLTRSNASADVTTAAPSRLFSIAKPKLEALFQSNAGIETAIHRLMGQDLVRKLLSASH